MNEKYPNSGSDSAEIFIEDYGQKTYEYKLLYEEAVRQLEALYDYADKNNISLPDPGSSYQ